MEGSHEHHLLSIEALTLLSSEYTAFYFTTEEKKKKDKVMCFKFKIFLLYSFAFINKKIK